MNKHLVYILLFAVISCNNNSYINNKSIRTNSEVNYSIGDSTNKLLPKKSEINNTITLFLESSTHNLPALFYFDEFDEQQYVVRPQETSNLKSKQPTKKTIPTTHPLFIEYIGVSLKNSTHVYYLLKPGDSIDITTSASNSIPVLAIRNKTQTARVNIFQQLSSLNKSITDLHFNELIFKKKRGTNYQSRYNRNRGI